MLYWTILVAILGQSLQTTLYDVRCEDVGRSEHQCYDKYNLTDDIVGGIPVVLTDGMLEKFCRHIGDILPCLHGLFEPCADPFYDFTSYKRTFLKVCNDREKYMNASMSCLDQTASVVSQCLRSYRTHIQTIDKEATPRTYQICTVITLLRGCITIDENESCIGENSEFLTELYRGRFLPATCDTDIHLHARDKNTHPVNMAHVLTSLYVNAGFGTIYICLLAMLWRI